MFLTRAEEKGDAPFLWAKRDGEWRSISWAEAARQVASLAAALKRIGLRARRPGRAGQREPARMADLRPRDHGRGLRDRADLHHQYRARPCAYPRQYRRARGDRLDPEAGEEPDPGGAHLEPSAIMSSAMEPMRSGQAPDWVNCHHWPKLAVGEADVEALEEGGRGDSARRPRLHHLHQRHRRRAARRAAASRRDPPQSRRRDRNDLDGFRLGRRGVPVVPPRQPRL